MGEKMSRKWRQLARRHAAFTWVVVFLAIGIPLNITSAYNLSKYIIHNYLSEQMLPLTGDNIYTEIQRDVLKPVLISSLMAQDTFVRDWILDGERDMGSMVKYLAEVKRKYGAFTAYLISDRTRQYYYAGGILKRLKAEDPHDTWYFSARTMQTPYRTEVDSDQANGNMMTIFVNYRVYDYRGEFLGITGIGLALDAMSTMVASYQQRFHRNIYFVTPSGDIVLTGKILSGADRTIRGLYGLRDIADKILHGTTTPISLEYESNGRTFLINSRFLPELGWYLVVEQDVNEELVTAIGALARNLTKTTILALVCLGALLFAVLKVQNGWRRHAQGYIQVGEVSSAGLSAILPNLMREAEDQGSFLSLIHLDIDNSDDESERHNSEADDQIAGKLAKLVRAEIQSNDLLVRWWRREFLILLRNSDLVQAVTVAEKIRQAISSHRFPKIRFPSE
ncbi:cache domain-containing protein [Cupriavidus sp. D39]|uniref:cache domain-containing protein n=1 Tax=Cupriavidus sp. D39 TaxID=2997877 RepID=UPI002271CAFB|nr:cache domain-containing protein [Cupriavidus sp. D39]MCY0858771.1 diguanylate cyclase [Cupriavidus sp. D39]